MQGLPVHWLQDERITLPTQAGEIDVIGLHCTHRPHLDGPRLEQQIDPASPNFTVLLYHTPDLAPQSAQLGIDLQLSGHTHGGQVRLPLFGALVTGSLYGKRFEAGRVQLEQMVLYITRGLGMEGMGAPRVRFLCPPEIILWELSGIDSQPIL
jgi:predicted MPP superfamily phosphohydrolase